MSHKLKMRRVFRIGRRSPEKASAKLMPVSRIKVLIAVVVASVLLLTGSCVYMAVNGFGFYVHETHSVVYSLYTDNAKIALDEIYELPRESGYSQIEQTEMLTICTSEYKTGEACVTLSQRLIGNTYTVDTENKTVEEIFVNGNRGFYIEMENDAYITWQMDGYIFTVTGNVTKEEAVRLAEITTRK